MRVIFTMGLVNPENIIWDNFGRLNSGKCNNLVKNKDMIRLWKGTSSTFMLTFMIYYQTHRYERYLLLSRTLIFFRDVLDFKRDNIYEISRFYNFNLTLDFWFFFFCSFNVFIYMIINHPDFQQQQNL